MAIDPFDAKKIYAGYWDVGFLRSLDGGLSWQRSVEGLLHEGNVFHIQPDVLTKDLLWASSGAWTYDAGSMALSENSGASWKVIGTAQNGLPDIPIYDFLVSSTANAGRRILVLSYGKGPYLSDDWSATWRAVLDEHRKAPFRYGYALTVDPIDQNILYAGDDDGGTAHVAPETTYSGGGVWKSFDAGETWEKTYNADFAIAIEADPSVPGRFYMGTTESPYKDREYVKGILRSDDWGESWETYNTGLGIQKVSAIAVDPADSEHMIIGTPGAGLFHIFGISNMK